MIKTFCVAGHTFSLTLPDNSEIWDYLKNYRPFEVEAGETIFDLELVDSLEEMTLDPVFSQADESEPDMSRIDLLRSGDNWVIDFYVNMSSPLVARVVCDDCFKKGRLHVMDDNRRAAIFAVNNSLMLMYAFRTASEKTLEMHASVTVKDGKGYLFLGKSGTGKSTHSRMWLENIPQTWLLNDDNPVMRVLPDGTVRVYGTPWSGKTPCYKNKDVEVGAVVLIRRCPENKATLLKLPEAYATIFSSCSGFKADEDMSEHLYETVAGIVTAVPCFVMDCRPDADAAQVCVSAVCV